MTISLVGDGNWQHVDRDKLNQISVAPARAQPERRGPHCLGENILIQSQAHERQPELFQPRREPHPCHPGKAGNRHLSRQRPLPAQNPPNAAPRPTNMARPSMMMPSEISTGATIDATAPNPNSSPVASDNWHGCQPRPQQTAVATSEQRHQADRLQERNNDFRYWHFWTCLELKLAGP